MRIVYENIYFAIGIKLICLFLGTIGIANMWMAIFADVGVMVIAVLNAIRALFVNEVIMLRLSIFRRRGETHGKRKDRMLQ